jgi:hypothetical protein
MSVQHTTPTHAINSTGEPVWLRRTLIGIALGLCVLVSHLAIGCSVH